VKFGTTDKSGPIVIWK